MDIIAVIDNIYQNINIYKSIIITDKNNIRDLVSTLCDLDYPATDIDNLNDNSRVIVIPDDINIDTLGLLLLSQITVILYYNCGHPINDHAYYKNNGFINLSIMIAF
jgi:hypothetical protein